MDHQSFAQLLGNYGEFFGAIAVVVTLVYLAGQLRQNTNALKSASYQHWNEISGAFTDFYAAYAQELTEIEECDSLDQLTPEQMKIYSALAAKTFNQAEAAYLQHRAGTLDVDVFETRIASFRNFVEPNPLLQQMWHLGFAVRASDFVEYVESNVSALRAES